MSLADQLASIEVLNPVGERVALGDMWRERTAVVAFVRHFG